MQCLLQQKLIDVIYTTDGKEYLTPDELGKEIVEELQVHGGRSQLASVYIGNEYRIYWFTSPGVYLESTFDPAFVRDQRLFEAGLYCFLSVLNDRISCQDRLRGSLLH